MADPVDSNIAEQVDALLARLAAMSVEVTRSMKKTLAASGLRWQGEMRKRMQGPRFLGPGKSPTDLLATRRGSAGLAGSFGSQVAGEDIDGMVLSEYSTSRIAPVHEKGTVGAGGTMPDIVPRNRQWLTIPLEAAMTPSGVPRRPGPRDWPGLFFLQTPAMQAANRAYLVRPKNFVPTGLDSQELRFVEGAAGLRRRKSSKPKDALEFLYMLVKKVALPPRLGMQLTENRLAPQRLIDFQRFLEGELARSTS